MTRGSHSRLLEERATYSRLRVEELTRRLNRIPNESRPTNLAAFCAGSYARLEASCYSDIDLFFVYGGEEVSNIDRRIREIKFFAHVISSAEQMEFPPFSNDAQYLRTMSMNQMLKHLGAPEDDGLNHFTMRMLLLLESRCLFGNETFARVQREVISAYYRDYPDHQSSFEPWFLLNDIGRFWKTLLLNYENKRNQPAADEEQKNRQKVRNFKLKYSRMTTCFATIAALASMNDPIGEDDVLQLIQLTPIERLRSVKERVPDAKDKVDRVVDEYSWFIEQTGKSSEALHAGFQDRQRRQENFQRANQYGDIMFDLLFAISELSSRSGRFLRYLVI